ncbi:hypothetical protein ALO94_201098 [Pseudomonas syringae pv. spinaceae]|uniref:Siderophore biosynthesis protein SbnG n=1 Tax=Pseudomonas syringae pv. spinaceae TaxID=264459 RepID=A0A0Q0AY19_PSESX|nr:hypothetical protein ALO94_201098 [Pseudomonas syringae pv. spinaceae]
MLLRVTLAQRAFAKVFAADSFEPGLGLRTVEPVFGVATQITQYRARLDGSQLVFVAEQNHARVRRQCVEQVGHHFQVDHGRFVDDQHVQWQQVAGVVTEVTRAGTTAQQAVHGGDFTGDFLPHLGADVQALHLLADGFGQTCCRLARRRCQTNAQRLAALHGRSLKQRQQAHHGGSFARAGAAGDDAECPAGCQCAGQFLPVDDGVRR